MKLHEALRPLRPGHLLLALRVRLAALRPRFADVDSGIIYAMKLADFPQVQNLPIAQKLQLVDELWASLIEDLESLDASNEEKELLDARWAEFLANPESALTVDEFSERISVSRVSEKSVSSRRCSKI